MSEEKHCCEQMTRIVSYRCETHPDPFDCADNLIHYSAQFDEHGLIVDDGGSASIVISYCPWCGAKLPESKR